MRISFLKEYVVLVEEMSYTEASKRLFITQSTLSKHMAALESDLKATLVVRDASGLHLTEIGKAFYDDAVAMVNAYANTLDRVAALKEGRESVLKIGYVSPVAQRFIDQDTFCDGIANELNGPALFILWQYACCVRIIAEKFYRTPEGFMPSVRHFVCTLEDDTHHMISRLLGPHTKMLSQRNFNPGPIIHLNPQMGHR